MISLPFLSSTRFSLPSSQRSSIQRSPPTRSGTNRVQHIQGSCATSPHSSLRRVSVLSCSCLFYVISPCLVSGLLPSHAMESRVSRQPLRISRAMHASLASQHNTPPYFFSMLNQPTGMVWDMCLLHELMGNLALYFGVIAHGCVDGGTGGPLCILLAGVLLPQKQLCLILHGWVIWRQVKQSCGFWAVRSDLLLSCHSFFSYFFYMTFLTASKWTARRLAGWEFTLRYILSSASPPSKINSQSLFLNLIPSQQCKLNNPRKSFSGRNLLDPMSWHQLSK